MNTEKIIDNLNLQGAQIKALQIHQERMAQRLDIYAKSMDAYVPRTINPDVGNYKSPMWEAIKCIDEIVSKANALSQPIVSERMSVTPGWNGRQVADWTRFVAEEPKTNGWYDTFGDKGQLKKWWGGDIWYDSDNQDIVDPFPGKVFFWRPIPSSLKMKVSLNDTSPEFHAFLKETRTTFSVSGMHTELHVNGVELFFLASAWGQQQYIKTFPDRVMTLEQAIKVLVTALKNDPGYFDGWKANIAMAFINEWNTNMGPGFENKAKQAAIRFLGNLMRDSSMYHTQKSVEITSSVVKGFDLADDKKNGNGQSEPLKARYSAENNQPGITYYPYETFIGIKKDGKSFFALQAGKWFKDSERPVPFQLRTIQGEKVLCEDYPSGLGWAGKTEDFVNAALAGRLRLIDPPQDERKYRYFVTMPWGAKVPEYDGKKPPFAAPTVKLKVGQVWQSKNYNHQIRGFSGHSVIVRIDAEGMRATLIEVGLPEFRKEIEKGEYTLRP